jgi:hypothetical protein
MAIRRKVYTLDQIATRAKVAAKRPLSVSEMADFKKMADDLKVSDLEIAKLRKDLDESNKRLADANAAQFIKETLNRRHIRRASTVARRRQKYVEAMVKLGYTRSADLAGRKSVGRGVAVTEQQAKAEIEDVLGIVPGRVVFVSEPDAPYAAKIQGETVTLNLAKTAPGTVANVIMEEGLHGVWNDPEIQAAWNEWREMVTPEDLAEIKERRAALGESDTVLFEEAVIDRLIRNDPADRSMIRKFVDAIMNAFRRLLGWEVKDSEVARNKLFEAAKRFYTANQGAVTGQRFAAPTVTPAQDAAYIDTVQRGDTEAAQTMVDEAAKAAGWRKVFHGTNAEPFTQFSRMREGRFGKAVYTSVDESRAKDYGQRVMALYASPEASVYGPIIYSSNPNNFKSADAVTYDDAGNVVPLSQRFDPANPDIRFAAPTNEDAMPEPDDVANETGPSYEVASLIAAIARTYVEDGSATTLEAVVAKLQTEFPQLSETDIFMSLAGHVKNKEAAIQTEITKRLKDLTKQANIWSQINTLLEGKLPDKRTVAKDTETVASIRVLLHEIRKESLKTVKDQQQLKAIHQRLDDAMDQLEKGYRWIPEEAAPDTPAVAAAKEELAKVRQETRLVDAISEAEAVLRGEEATPREERTPEATGRILSLQKRLKGLRKQIALDDVMEGRKERLTKREAELRAAIAAGTTVPKTAKASTPDTADVATLRETVRDLERMMNVQASIRDLQEQLRTGVPKIAVAKDSDAEKSEALIAALARQRTLKRKVADMIEANRKMTGKEMFIEGLLAPRTLMATGDWSAIGRQALPLLGASIIGGRFGAIRDAFVKAAEGTFSEGKADATMAALANDPRAPMREAAKLWLADYNQGLTNREETFIGRLLEKLKWAGAPIRASNRHMALFINLLRVSTFDAFVERHPEATLATRTAYADFINVASGRGNLGRAESAAQLLAIFFFAPRYAVSRFQMLYSPFKYARDPLVRNAIAKDLVGFVLTGLTVNLLAGLAGAEIGEDPTTADFGKAKWGNLRIDLWGGTTQPMRLIISPIIQAMQARKIEALDFENNVETRDAFFRWLGYKFSPAVTVPYGLIAKEDMIGRPQEEWETLVRAVVPLTLAETVDAYYEEESAGTAAAVFGANFFGAGASVYEDKRKKKY